MKSVPISVRVSQDEAEYLARLHIPGATTPSEKLRALIAEAHHRQQRPGNYAESASQAQQWLAPLLETIQGAETRHEQHSDIVALLREWLPDFLAHIRLAGIRDNRELGMEEMHALEKGIAERIIRLMDRVLHLALISRCHCYDPELINKRMDQIQQLAVLITLQKESNKERL